MAIGDAYATAAEYRARVDKTDTTDDTIIDGQLKAISHYIDSRCRRRDGFNQSATVVTRIYDGNGKQRLWIPDDIATSVGLIVKCDLNGDYDYGDSGESLTLNTHYWVGPWNADQSADPQPYEFLELKPSNPVVTVWPKQIRAVEVNAKFGWPEVPEAIKEAAMAITRQLRDLEESGFSQAFQAIDAAITLAPTAPGLLRDIKRQYARPQSF